VGGNSIFTDREEGNTAVRSRRREFKKGLVFLASEQSFLCAGSLKMSPRKKDTFYMTSVKVSGFPFSGAPKTDAFCSVLHKKAQPKTWEKGYYFY